MAAKKSSQRISYQKAKDKSFWPLFLFLVFIILLVGGFLIYKYWQKQNYYASIKSFVFTSSTGPVSPEFQSTKTITLTVDSCTYAVTDNSGTTNQKCSITKTDFDSLVDLYYTSGVGTKIGYNNNATNKTLIGGATKIITINFADGTTTTTTLTTDFKTNTQNFINTVNNYVSQFKELSF